MITQCKNSLQHNGDTFVNSISTDVLCYVTPSYKIYERRTMIMTTDLDIADININSFNEHHI